MANIDLGNLTRYDGKIKQYAEDKYLSKNTANWQMTEKAGAVTCYPVPDTELEPIVDFSFKEIPPTSGDKSPSNPSTIEGVGNIKVTRCGKNLIPFPYTSLSQTAYDIIWTVSSDGTVAASGTATANSFFTFYDTDSGILKPGLRYTLSCCPSGGSASTYYVRFGSGSVYDDTGNGAIFTADTALASRNLIARIASGTTVSMPITFKPQIELGSIITSFEPYAGTDYTIQLGNTYYGGSVNLATGLMTVTHYEYAFTGEETGWWERTEFTNTVRFGMYGDSWGDLFKAIKDPHLSACSHFVLDYAYYTDTPHFYIGSTGNQYYFYPDHTFSREDWTAWLAQQYAAGHPLTVCSELANPYTVQLNPIQIKSLTALDKNTPRLNTLYTDADSIQVGYQKHPARTAYELENAILALGGGE